MINNNKTLMLGWPVKPPQKWLQRYPDIEVARIYRENVNWWEKKLALVHYLWLGRPSPIFVLD